MKRELTLKKSKQVKIDSDEVKYLDEIIFIDMLHLQQTSEDTTIPESLLKKINRKS